jgi:hypothetical protein
LTKIAKVRGWRGLRKDENLEAEMPPENGTQLEWLPFLAFTGWRFKIWFPQEGSSLPMQRQVQPDHSGQLAQLRASDI